MKVRATLAGVMIASMALVSTPLAASAVPMTSAGPLRSVDISPDLNCGVYHVGDLFGEFFGGTACGTFASVNGTLYGPAVVPGNTLARTGWTPVSQQNGGSGTASDPFTTTTVVTGGPIELTQTDTYVVGTEFYNTTMTTTNTSDAPVELVVYHAADCYLQGDDNGFGDHDATTGAVTCKAAGDGGRIQQFIPMSSGSDYLYSRYYQLWDAVNSQISLPDEVRDADQLIDNAMALSWPLSITAGAAASVSMMTNFSAIGIRPLPSTLVASPTTAPTTVPVTMAATITNPNVLDQDLPEALVVLPEGVSYIPGSAADIAEPTISGRTLIFPGRRIAAEGTFAWTFGVTADTAVSGTATLNGTTVGGSPVVESTTSLAFVPALVAADDTVTAPFNTPVTVDVLRNDTGDQVSVTSVGDSANGTTTINGDGSITFTPATDFFGETAFDYVITDVDGATSTATVTVTVALPPVPSAPSTTVETELETPVVVDALRNATGVGIVLSDVSGASQGAVVMKSDGTVTFTPEAGFVGETSFTYTVTDLAAQSATGTITVSVLARPVPSVTTPPVPAANLAQTGSAIPVTVAGVGLLALLLGTGTIVFARRRHTSR